MKVYMEGTALAKDVRPGMYIGDTDADPSGWALITEVSFRAQQPEVAITYEHVNYVERDRLVRRHPTCPLMVAVRYAEVFPDGFDFVRADQVVV